VARLILDTTVLVDAERGSSDALERLVGDEDDVAIAAITVAELAVGVELADGRNRRRRKAFADAVLDAVSIEGYETEVAFEHGVLLAHARRSGRPRGAHDLIVAATARARGREVVSADRDGFADLPQVEVRDAQSED
jgi:tRNA(fMet)-specific endonuclease VapC